MIGKTFPGAASRGLPVVFRPIALKKSSVTKYRSSCSDSSEETCSSSMPMRKSGSLIQTSMSRSRWNGCLSGVGRFDFVRGFRLVDERQLDGLFGDAELALDDFVNRKQFVQPPRGLGVEL